MIALELFVRALMTNLMARCADPRGATDKAREHLLNCVGTFRFQTTGSSEERAERVIELIRAKLEETFDIVHTRLVDDAERQAAQAGKRN
jgi:hypothetical protein